MKELPKEIFKIGFTASRPEAMFSLFFTFNRHFISLLFLPRKIIHKSSISTTFYFPVISPRISIAKTIFKSLLKKIKL